MKKIFIVAIATLLAFSGCKKDRLELGDPSSKLEGINATWELMEVVQVDIASIQQKTLNVSNAFIGDTPMKVSFNSSDFTYNVTAGSGPNYFGSAGTWAFDDNDYPTQITITTAAGKSIVLPLVNTIRTVDAFLTFKFNRYCDGADDPYIAYQFKFIRSN